MSLRKGWKAVTDDELYRQYLAGDQTAGDALILRWSDALIAYLDAFLHNMQDAEDLMMDCCSHMLPRLWNYLYHREYTPSGIRFQRPQRPYSCSDMSP